MSCLFHFLLPRLKGFPANRYQRLKDPGERSHPLDVLKKRHVLFKGFSKKKTVSSLQKEDYMQKEEGAFSKKYYLETAFRKLGEANTYRSRATTRKPFYFFWWHLPWVKGATFYKKKARGCFMEAQGLLRACCDDHKHKCADHGKDIEDKCIPRYIGEQMVNITVRLSAMRLSSEKNLSKSKDFPE